MHESRIVNGGHNNKNRDTDTYTHKSMLYRNTILYLYLH